MNPRSEVGSVSFWSLWSWLLSNTACFLQLPPHHMIKIMFIKTVSILLSSSSNATSSCEGYLMDRRYFLGAHCSMLLLSYCGSLFTYVPIKYRPPDSKVLEVVLVIIALAQSPQILILWKNIHKNPIIIIITNILPVMAYLPKGAQYRKKNYKLWCQT